MKAGRYSVTALQTDLFRLDGGAMFGSVPRALWSRHFEPDSSNRISLTTRVLFAEGDGRNILVDTGTGNLWSEKELGLYEFEAATEPGVVLALKRIGVAPEEITDVIITHLHFDHAGGVTRRGADGDPVPTFPNATCHIQRGNWETARDPNERERRSYLRRHWEPLDGPHLDLAEGPGEIFPDVFLSCAEGHTAGLQVVRFGEGSEAVLFPSDLVPLSTHVAVPWTMGYDLCPRTIMQEKRVLLEQAAAQGWTVVFEHDALTEGARVAMKGDRFEVAEKLDLGGGAPRGHPASS